MDDMAGHRHGGFRRGTALLKGSELTVSAEGIIIVLLSAVGYASYITGVNKSRVRKYEQPQTGILRIHCQHRAFCH